MGVVRNRVVLAYPDENGTQQPQDQVQSPPSESGSTSDTEPPQPIGLYRRRNRGGKTAKFAGDKVACGVPTPGNHAGKRKIRRHANEKTLQVYLRDDDEDQNVLLESYKDPFARLMDATSEPLECLNDFTQRLEQESMVEQTQDVKDKGELTPFYRISNKIRRSIKIRRNFPVLLIQTIEGDVVKFFQVNPQDIFCCVPSKSFERLMFHAVAQYHGLKSMSLAKNGHISVEVLNELEAWIPVDELLSKYIEEHIIN